MLAWISSASWKYVLKEGSSALAFLDFGSLILPQPVVHLYLLAEREAVSLCSHLLPRCIQLSIQSFEHFLLAVGPEVINSKMLGATMCGGLSEQSRLQCMDRDCTVVGIEWNHKRPTHRQVVKYQ